MGKSRFTETQIVAILKEAEVGMNVADLCRKHSISDATYYKWKSKFDGMKASDLNGQVTSLATRWPMAVVSVPLRWWTISTGKRCISKSISRSHRFD